MGILEKNEKILKECREPFFENYIKVKDREIEKCFIQEIQNNEKIICYLKENRGWRLNSIYEPEKAAGLYAKRYNKLQDYAVACFFGVSDGKAIRKVLENTNDTHTIIIYEPELEIFLTAMECFELEDIIRNERVYLIVNGINEKELNNILSTIITYQNKELITDCILPNYDILFANQCKAYIEQIMYCMHREVFNRNTELLFGVKTGYNILCNLPYVLKSASVNDLAEYFRNVDLEDTPAIIVSAGPSLDRNIRELKNIKNRAFIVGVDSALKALLREEIPVDLAISVDFNKNPDVFSDERVYEIPFAVSVAALPLIIENNKKGLFFSKTIGFDSFNEVISKKTGKMIGALETGGSVATDAFSLVTAMGFKKIILIGQDLAFTGGKGHVSGFEKSEEANKDHVKNRITVEVEAIDGGKILTDVQMDYYRQWFEQHIADVNDKVTVYNATEGGARIHGTVEISLKEAIEKYCQSELDFGEMIKEVPQLLSDEEYQTVKEELLGTERYLEELKQKLQRGIRAYEELIDLDRKGKQHTKVYKRAVETISEMNELIETEVYMDFIQMYAKEAEYSATDNIYVEEELSVREIAQKGISLMQGYIKGISACKQHMKAVLFTKLQEEQE